MRTKGKNRETDRLDKLITKINLKETAKLLPLLEKFYSNRKTNYTTRLTLQRFARGWIRLESQGVGRVWEQNKKEKMESLQRYQKEMEAFTVFLKNYLKKQSSHASKNNQSKR